ncbi:SH3 domain-containing protein [Caryophanon tenue]|uniref:SH3b domain-containing protein n=1 Tax=Caryophanon tenue TaxID=33978 RepID=A0A1C0YAW1_9BACL|nr:SH3 domain-containing protein [Caryophanon tenue]OCS84314.1 hypothetical protein A6M13_15625 [Caryophanon tenue]
MKKLLIVLVFSMIACCSYTSKADAALSSILNVAKTNIPLQASASKHAETITMLERGDTVWTDGYTFAGWLKVVTNEGKGYVNASQVENIGWSVAPYELRFTMHKLTTGLTVERNGAYIDFEKGDFMYRAQTTQNTTISHADDIPQAFLTRIPPTIRAAKDAVVMMSKPSKSSNVLTTINANTAVESYGVVNKEWRIIRYADMIGYVPAKDMVALKGQTQYIKTDGVALFDSPNRVDANIMDILWSNIAVTAYPSTSGWSYVEYGSGQVRGYVPTEMLQHKQNATHSTSSEVLDETMVDKRIIKKETLANGDQQLTIRLSNRLHSHRDFFVATKKNNNTKLTLNTQSIIDFTYGRDGYMGEFSGYVETAAQLSKDTGVHFWTCGELCYEVNGEVKKFSVPAHDYIDPGFMVMSFIKPIGDGRFQVLMPTTTNPNFIDAYVTFAYNEKTQQIEEIERIILQNDDSEPLQKIQQVWLSNRFYVVQKSLMP